MAKRQALCRCWCGCWVGWYFSMLLFINQVKFLQDFFNSQCVGEISPRVVDGDVSSSILQNFRISFP